MFKNLVFSTNIDKETIVLKPSEEHKYTLIWLHGYGGQNKEFEDIFEQYQIVNRECTKIVLPNASLISMSYLQKSQSYRSWFDIKSFGEEGAWGCEIIDEISLKNSRKRLKEIVGEEVKLLNNDLSKVFIGGLSQGSIAALDFGLTFDEGQLGGIVGISGHLDDLTSIDSAKSNLPIFIFNGQNDRTMQFQYVQNSYQRLIDLKFNNLEIYFDYITAPKGQEHFYSILDPKIHKKIFEFFNKIQK